jgi:hypothetical protein
MRAFSESKSAVGAKFAIAGEKWNYVLKKLRRGVHWIERENEILFSQAGIRRLEVLIGSGAIILVPEDSKETEPPHEPAPESQTEMIVRRIPPNPGLVEAVVGDQPSVLHSVWVGNNQNFLVGDKVSAVPYPGVSGVWKLVSRLPISKIRPNVRQGL